MGDKVFGFKGQELYKFKGSKIYKFEWRPSWSFVGFTWRGEALRQSNRQAVSINLIC
jgi:hypothetical protein